MAATIVMWLGILFLVLGLLGAALALLRSRRTPATPQTEGGTFDPSAWAKLVDALAKAPLWISCTVVGILLIVLSNNL